MTVGVPPSITATTEFVVPRSMPMVFAMTVSLARPQRPLLVLPLPSRARLGLLDRVRPRQRVLPLGDLHQPAIVLAERPDLVLAEILDVDEPVARTLDGRHDLVQL